MESWGGSLERCTWRLECICISPKSAGMKRESRTIPPARSRYTRERAAGNYVHARRHTRAVVYRNARRLEHDGRKFDDAHPHLAGSRIRFGDEIFPEQSAVDDMFPYPGRSESFHQLHQSAGTNHPAK